MQYTSEEVVAIINRHVAPPLRQVGEEWVTRCPFHEDHYPSFYVHPERGVWHCFGCQAGGGVRSFLERVGGVRFEAKTDVSYSSPGVIGNKCSSFGGWLRELGMEKEAAVLEGCRQDFRWSRCNDCGEEFAHPITCKSRVCFHCAGVRSKIFLDEHQKKLDKLGSLSILELHFPLRAHLTRAMLKEARAIFKGLRNEELWEQMIPGGIYGFRLYPTQKGWEVAIIVLSQIPAKLELPLLVGWILRFQGQRARIRLREMASAEEAKEEFIRLCCLPPGWSRDGEQFGEWWFTVKGTRLVEGFGSCYRISGGQLKGKRVNAPVCPFCGSRNIKLLGWVCAKHCQLRDGVWFYTGPGAGTVLRGAPLTCGVGASAS